MNKDKEWEVEATIEIRTSFFCDTKEEAEKEAHKYLEELCTGLYPDCCSNSYEIEGERDVIPVSIINVRCIVAHIIKIENIKDGYDAAVTCRYDTQKATETIKIRGINTIVQFESIGYYSNILGCKKTKKGG